MIRIELRPPAAPGPSRVYRLAERLVSVDGPLPELEAFTASCAGRRWRGAGIEPPGGRREAGPRQLVFRGRAELGRRQRDIECRWAGAGYELNVAGVGRFAIAADGGRISLEGGACPRQGAELTETVLGPALILALALQGVWCLHASAVEIDGRAVAFLGISGAGKSTLGRALPEISPRFRPVADDVLPLILAVGEARVLPHFPQLKYGSGEQPGAAVAGSLPLAAVYLLDAPEAGSADRRHAVRRRGVAAEPLHGFAAALALVRHTVSARLFTAELLRRHTDLCARLTGLVPVRRLRYPRQRAILPQVEELLSRLTSNGRPT